MKATTIALGSLLALSACSQSQRPTDERNEAASLPTTFHFSQLVLRVLTSTINRQQGTTATLYGNALARQAALTGTGAARPGEVLALVTWQQQPDPNWFGARIPGALQSVEVLRTKPGPEGHPTVTYQLFAGKDLTLRTDTRHQQERIAYLLAQKPAVLP